MKSILKLIIALIALITAGCVSGNFNFSGMLNLKRLSAEQKQTKLYVKNQEKLFSRLWNDIEKGKLQVGSSREEITAHYGTPSAITQESDHEDSKTILYYRCPTQLIPAQEVRLYFNQEQRLSDWHDNRKDIAQMLLY
ncbi:MAG: hypothetical protein WC695_08900 [Candidatus Omnitrophota bacterium]